MRESRKRSGLPADEFAARLNQLLPNRSIDRTLVSRWEHGHHNPAASVLMAAMQLGGMDPELLTQPLAVELARWMRSVEERLTPRDAAKESRPRRTRS